MNRAAIYCRISEDPKLTGLGVERQQEDCRAFCEKNGWEIVSEYIENDTSAYSGKKRPKYEAMLDSIRAGKIDIVVAVHTDRLHRRLRDLVEYTDVVRDQFGNMKVATHTIKAGDIDLSTPSGIMMAHIKGAVDEAYVSEAREKNKRARLQIAQRGGRHQSARVYGWEEGGMKVRESEAKVVREICDMILDGKSQTTVANALNARGVPSPRGSRWIGISVKKVAERASNAGLRSHLGELYQGDWEPILDKEIWQHVCSVIEDRIDTPYHRSTGRKYLLTGWAVCGICGNKLSATVGSGERLAAYRCKKAHSHDRTHELGCGRLSRAIAPLERLVSESILYRLDSPAMADAVAQQQDQRAEVAELLKERRDQQSRLNALIEDFYTSKLMSRPQFLRAKDAAEAKLKAISAQLSNLGNRDRLTVLNLSNQLSESWETGTIQWKRDVVELLVDRVIVHPYKPHAPVVWWNGFRFDPELVEIRWRA